MKTASLTVLAASLTVLAASPTVLAAPLTVLPRRQCWNSRPRSSRKSSPVD